MVKYDRLNYMEGSMWMSEKVMKEVVKFRESLVDMAR